MKEEGHQVALFFPVAIPIFFVLWLSVFDYSQHFQVERQSNGLPAGLE